MSKRVLIVTSHVRNEHGNDIAVYDGHATDDGIETIVVNESLGGTPIPSAWRDLAVKLGASSLVDVPEPKHRNYREMIGAPAGTYWCNDGNTTIAIKVDTPDIWSARTATIPGNAWRFAISRDEHARTNDQWLKDAKFFGPIAPPEF